MSALPSVQLPLQVPIEVMMGHPNGNVLYIVQIVGLSKKGPGWIQAFVSGHFADNISKGRK